MSIVIFSLIILITITKNSIIVIILSLEKGQSRLVVSKTRISSDLEFLEEAAGFCLFQNNLDFLRSYPNWIFKW